MVSPVAGEEVAVEGDGKGEAHASLVQAQGPLDAQVRQLQGGGGRRDRTLNGRAMRPPRQFQNSTEHYCSPDCSILMLIHADDDCDTS